MVKSLTVEFENEELFNSISVVKRKHRLTWKEMLQYAKHKLDGSPLTWRLGNKTK